MPLDRKQNGFGLVAAMFLIIIIAVVIAAMARLASTQNITNSLAIQQARAYQAARAGLEYGIARSLAQASPPADFDAELMLDGFRVRVEARPSLPIDVSEEDKSLVFYKVDAVASYGSSNNPDYAFRRLTAVVER